MHRIANNLVRVSKAQSPASSSSSTTRMVMIINQRKAGMTSATRGYATDNDDGIGKDTTNASGQPRDPAQIKNHDAAQESQSKSAPMEEGHTIDRSKSNTRFQDTQSQEATKAKEERDHGYSKSDLDAATLANKDTAGEAQKQRNANSTDSAEGQKYNPGQKGEQVGGGAANDVPLKEGEGMGSKEEAPSSSTLGGLGQFAKNIIGQGPASGKSFSTYARLQAGAKSTPSSAVDKGARKPKDTNVEGAQTPHLPHHQKGEGDQMPAVQNDAGLPSKGGKTPSDKKTTDGTATTKASANEGKGPSHDARPTGTQDTPGSRAVDPATNTHSPSFAPHTGAQATYSHVVNSPEPDSHKSKYVYAEATSDGAIPSGKAPRSSTSRDAYNPVTTGDILKNEAGIGSSNKMHRNNQDEAGEMVEEMIGRAPGQAGDDVGGRGRKFAPPPDVGEIEEDTLPKPIR